MQPFIPAPQQVQLPLFEAFIAKPVLPGFKAREQPRKSIQPELFSELALRGARAIARACWRLSCAS
jgi:cell division inhibitor SulA